MHTQTPSKASCLPNSAKAFDPLVTARPLKLSTGQARHTRQIADLLDKSSTAIGYASDIGHDKSPGTGIIVADPTRGARPARSMQTRHFGSGRTTNTSKGHGMAPLTIVIAAASMAADAHRGIHGHRPTV